MNNTFIDILNHTQASLDIDEIFEDILTYIRYLEYEWSPISGRSFRIYSNIFEDLLTSTNDVLNNILKYLQISSNIKDFLNDIIDDPLISFHMMDVLQGVFEYLQVSSMIEAKVICKHPYTSLSVHDILKDTFKGYP